MESIDGINHASAVGRGATGQREEREEHKMSVFHLSAGISAGKESKQ